VHIPVLVTEVLSIINPKSEDRILDATFGGGGHSLALIEASECYVFGVDRDPDAVHRAAKIKCKYPNNFDFILGYFSELHSITNLVEKFNGVLFDFGMSSFQIDDPSRGFAFSKNGKLDMRMSKSGISACDVVNTFSEKDLAEIIWKYGDESRSRKIASEIVRIRKIKKIEYTIELRDIIRNVFPFTSMKKTYSKLDVATKTFQALRIFVNDELAEIDTALKQLPQILRNNARIAVISFHALEDKIVKHWSKLNKNHIIPLNKSIIRPSKEEIKKNPRSRAAILRGFIYNKDGMLDEK
jgi:16S rRNA (cytosine1402-N4)-methyltransferase